MFQTFFFSERWNASAEGFAGGTLGSKERERERKCVCEEKSCPAHLLQLLGSYAIVPRNGSYAYKKHLYPQVCFQEVQFQSAKSFKPD